MLINDQYVPSHCDSVQSINEYIMNIFIYGLYVHAESVPINGLYVHAVIEASCIHELEEDMQYITIKYLWSLRGHIIYKSPQ
jgi:hypothetical protein